MYNAVSGAETCITTCIHIPPFTCMERCSSLRKSPAYAEIRYITRRDTAPHRLLFQWALVPALSVLKTELTPIVRLTTATYIWRSAGLVAYQPCAAEFGPSRKRSPYVSSAISVCDPVRCISRDLFLLSEIALLKLSRLPRWLSMLTLRLSSIPSWLSAFCLLLRPIYLS